MTPDLITPASPAGYLTSEAANRERSFLTSVCPILPTREPGSGRQQRLPAASESSEDGKHQGNTLWKTSGKHGVENIRETRCGKHQRNAVWKISGKHGVESIRETRCSRCSTAATCWLLRMQDWQCQLLMMPIICSGVCFPTA